MKICHIITRMDFAGAPDIVAMVCRYQFNQGHEVWLVTGTSGNLTAKTKYFFKEFSGRVRLIPNLQRAINLRIDLIVLFQLWLFLRKGKFDAVCCHTSKAGFLGRFAAWFAGVKIIVYMPHGHIFYGYFNRLMSNIFIWLERFAAKITRTIIVLTDLEKQDFIRCAAVPEKKLKIVPSGLNMDEFPITPDKIELRKRLQLPLDLNLVGLVCRLEPVKGADIFLNAALSLACRRQDIMFIIAGDGSLAQALRQQAANEGLSERFKFLGWRDDSRDIIGCLDILAQPSRNEAVGRVIIEAQAMGITVIAAAVGGIPTIIKDQETGILIDSQDVRGLSAGINWLLDNPIERQRIGSAAAVWARQNFNADEMTKKIHEAFT